MTDTVHIIGAGLAGLSAAVELTQAGRSVVLYEGAGQAGGRCRSFYDDTLDRRIDNGSHLVLSGNRAVHRYADIIGADQPFHVPDRAAYPFVDLKTGERWTVRPDRGFIPWSILLGHGRVPGSSLGDYLKGVRFARAKPTDTFDDLLRDTGVLYERFWEPLAVGVLNTPLDQASAQLLWPVIKETFGRGEAACRPAIARLGLSEALVDPAVAWLQEKGVEIHFNQRVRHLAVEGETVKSLEFQTSNRDLGPQEVVVSAVPSWAAATLVPGLNTPKGSHPIVNVHYRVPVRVEAPRLIGLVGGWGHWVFQRGDVASVTISAADEVARRDAADIAARVWPEVCTAISVDGDKALPPYRVVKEKRATFSQTPSALPQRPPTVSGVKNLFLAGDWTDTGYPATIEGSILSGVKAARAIGIPW